VGHLTPFLDEPRDVPYFKTHAQKMGEAIETVARYREAVGDDVDLCIEIHRRLTPAEAVVLAQGIAPYHPFFYEDPILPDNFDAMGLVAHGISIPIATGERLHTIQEFEMLLSRGAVQYVRPDVCLAGGLSASKKVAALAEAHNVMVVPHNPLSPVSTAACIQLAACIPNFALQEYPLGEGEPPKSEIVVSPLTLEQGFLIVPDGPGLGIELAEGMPVGDDVPYVTRLWFETRVACQRGGPGYVIGEDAEDRVTLEPRPIRQELAFVHHLLDQPWFTAYPAEVREAVAVKLTRIHLFGSVHYRPDPGFWTPTERQDLTDVAEGLEAAAPGHTAVLSRADRSLLDVILDPLVPAEQLAALSVARRRHGTPGTVLTRDLRHLLRREAPPRFMAASLLTR